jgi:glycerophosphoryl diester phosphodiesterase
MMQPEHFPEPPISYLIGHRGLPSLAPENSLSAFKLATEAGLNWVEFDVQVTQDDQLVLMHDDTINRTTTGTGEVYKLSFDSLQACKLTHKNKPTLEAIPTLTETLSYLNQQNIYANIELKLPEALAESQLAPIRTKLLNAFLRYLESECPKNKPWPLVSSFDHAILIRLRKIYPDLPIGFLIEEPLALHLDLAKQHSPASINAADEYITHEFINLANKQNIPILVYTVNNLERAQQLIRWGAYGVFTDIGNILKNSSA